MLIIGELINASRKTVGAAIEIGDAGAIQKMAKEQADAGSDYIDVNAGIFLDREPEYLQWLVKTVQDVARKPCSIESPNSEAIKKAFAVHKGLPMINSISLEKERYDNLMPIISGTEMKVIALCMSDEGMPQTVSDRLKIADRLINALVQNKVPINNIYVDPLVQPLSVNDRFGSNFINTVEQIKQTFEGVHTACGLSNISYGLPERKLLNQTFVIMAMAKGLDGAIINPLDKKIVASIIAAEALMGRDEYCTNYLSAYRSQNLGVS